MSSDGPRYGLVDREYGIRLAATSPSDDGPVWMVNLMKYREVADYVDGRKTAISGQEADPYSLYLLVFYNQLQISIQLL